MGERIKLMVQNQDEMIKAGRLSTPYNGVMDCFRRTIADEGIVSLWRGNTANVLRYFPTQALNFAFKDKIKSMFNKSKEKDGQLAVFMANIASGGCAGALSFVLVLLMTLKQQRKQEKVLVNVNLMVFLMFTKRHTQVTVLLDCTVDLWFHVLVLLYTVDVISVFMILLNQSF